jgi:hypothetical protein
MDGDHLDPDEQVRDLLQTLRRVKAKEEKMNKRAMEEKTGAKLVYGDVIQLLHCKTGKWLVVDEHQVATAEPENMKVRLSSDASMFSWFTVEPAAKFFFEVLSFCCLVGFPLFLIECIFVARETQCAILLACVSAARRESSTCTWARESSMKKIC